MPADKPCCALAEAAQGALTWSDETGDVGGHSHERDPAGDCGACGVFEPLREALAAHAASHAEECGACVGLGQVASTTGINFRSVERCYACAGTGKRLPEKGGE